MSDNVSTIALAGVDLCDPVTIAAEVSSTSHATNPVPINGLSTGPVLVPAGGGEVVVTGVPIEWAEAPTTSYVAVQARKVGTTTWGTIGLPIGPTSKGLVDSTAVDVYGPIRAPFAPDGTNLKVADQIEFRLVVLAASAKAFDVHPHGLKLTVKGA